MDNEKWFDRWFAFAAVLAVTVVGVAVWAVIKLVSWVVTL